VEAVNLTVIVTTVPERDQLLTRCLWHLQNQSVTDFEVIVCHGKRPKGDKVMRAFPYVDTSHVMFVDDDDWVSTRLVESVLPFDEDFVGYDALQMVDGQFSQIIYQEIASHICPIRTELAKEVEFGNHYLADIEWTKEVAKAVTSSTYINQSLYFYDKWNQNEGGWSPPRSVGYWPVDKSRFRWL
jgi:hypothetical protein